MKVQFKLAESQPIIKPNQDLKWESRGIISPSVVRDDKKWRMIYRAIGSDKKIRLGYAESLDGINWQKLEEPLVIPDKSILENCGIDDPIMSKVTDRYLISFTSYIQNKNYVKTKIKVLSTKDFDKFISITPKFADHWRKSFPGDVIYPEKINGIFYPIHNLNPNIQFGFSNFLRRWSDSAVMLATAANEWESKKISVGVPPIKTELGWMAFYHGIDERGGISLGAAVFDSPNPSKILYRLPYPVLTTGELYKKEEKFPNISFGTRAIESDGKYRLYFTKENNCIDLAEVSKNELIKELRKHPIRHVLEKNKKVIDFLQLVSAGSNPKSSYVDEDFLE